MLTALLRMPLTTRWLRVSPRSSNGLIGFRFEAYGCSSEKQLFSFEGKTNIDAFNKGSRHGKNTSPLEFLFKFLRSRCLILVCFETLSQNLPISKTSQTRKKICFAISQSWIYHSLPLYEELKSTVSNLFTIGFNVTTLLQTLRCVTRWDRKGQARGNSVIFHASCLC